MPFTEIEVPYTKLPPEYVDRLTALTKTESVTAADLASVLPMLASSLLILNQSVEQLAASVLSAIQQYGEALQRTPSRASPPEHRPAPPAGT